MDAFEYYKKLYEDTLAQRDQLGTAAAIPIGALTVVASILAYVAQRVDFRQQLTGPLLSFLGLLAAVCFARAAYLLIRSYHGYTYRQVPLPMEIHQWEEEIAKLYAAAGRPLSEAWERATAELCIRYVEESDVNARNNVERGELLFLANRWVVYTFGLVLMAGVAAVANVRLQPLVIPSVRILQDAGSIPMADQKTPDPVQAPPIKVPPPPPGKDIRVIVPKKSNPVPSPNRPVPLPTREPA
jgi:hypothetical protein